MLFQFPEYFYLLLALPVLAGLYAWFYLRTRRQRREWATPAAWQRLSPLRSDRRRHAKFAMLLLAYTAGVFVLARPSYGIGERTEKKKGIEAIVVMDVSQSMNAQDVQPSRLECAKTLVSTLIDRMQNDRIGLCIFAGEAYPQLPITQDFTSAKVFLDAINTNMVTLQGTNLAAAIELAEASFSDDTSVGKAIIIVTDGENHEEGAEEAAAEAAKNGRNIFVLGVGTAEGATIPTRIGPLQDERGSVVRTCLNEQMCRDVAAAGKGAYLHLDGSATPTQQLLAALSHMKQSESVVTYASYNEQFQAVALILFLLLLVEAFLFEAKNPWLLRRQFIKKKSAGKPAALTAVLAMLVFSALPSTATAQTRDWKHIHQGNRAFAAQQYAQAADRYRRIVERDSTNARAQFNLGDAFLGQGNPQEAMKHFDAALKYETSPIVKGMIHYNRGFIWLNNALQSKDDEQQQLLRAAIEEYKSTLRISPWDDDARYNLALCQYLLKDGGQGGNSQNQQQQQRQQQDQQKKQDQQQQQQNQQQQDEQEKPKEQTNPQTQQYYNMMRQNEKKTLERVKQQRVRGVRGGKNW